jgi:hypothetical protein
MTTTLEAPPTNRTTWEHLVRHVTDRAVTKFDLAVTPQDLTIEHHTGQLVAFRNRPLAFNEIGLAQFARRIGVPASYMAKLYEKDRELFARNVTRWLHDGGTLPQDGEFLLRCDSDSQGNEFVRAALSDQYGIIDDVHLVDATVAAIEASGLIDEFTIEQAVTTDRSLHIRVSARDRAFDAARLLGIGSTDPDLLFPMLHFSNSEVGLGSANLEGGVFRPKCLNGLVALVGQLGRFAKRHIGSGGDLQARLTAQAPTILEGAVQLTQQFAESQEIKLVTADAVAQLRNLFARTHVSRAVEQDVLHHLGNGFTTTRYDVVNAVTAAARPLHYDDRLHLERLAAQVLNLN